MAKLPAIPTGKELELFLAALFQASGFFVEKNIVEPDLLELDAVVTSYKPTPGESILIEVKSGNWGFSDVFKILGWKTYLGLPKAAFFVRTSQEKPDFTIKKRKLEPYGVQLVEIEEIEKAREVFLSEGFPPIADELMFSIWRYSYWMEAQLIETLRQARKSFPDRVGPKEALDYYSLVNNTVFFVKDKLQKVLELYQAYQRHPRLTLGVASEMAGKSYDPETADPNNQFIREAIWNCKHYLLQACLYVEHRARLSIMKSVVDYLIEKQAGKVTDAGREQELPDNCRLALEQLEQAEAFSLYPYLWQVFLWGWGGFLLKDREEELAQLSTQTGLTVQGINDAFRIYDEFFPINNGWWTEQHNTHWRMVKLVPAPFRGLGTFQRFTRLNFKSYRDFGYTDMTTRDLVKWHNAGADLIEKDTSDLVKV